MVSWREKIKGHMTGRGKYGISATGKTGKRSLVDQTYRTKAKATAHLNYARKDPRMKKYGRLMLVKLR